MPSPGTRSWSRRVFDWPGIGFMAREAIKQQDFYLIQAIVFVVAVMVVIINIAIDVVVQVPRPARDLSREEREGDDLHAARRVHRPAARRGGGRRRRGDAARPTVRDSTRRAHGGLFRELVRDKLGLVSLAFLVVLLVVAIFAPLIAPDDPNDGQPQQRDGVAGVARRHVDATRWAPTGRATTCSPGCSTAPGRRCSSACSSCFVAGTFGVLIGLFAGYKGGRTDRWLMGWVDVQVSFPGLLLAMLLIALVGGSVVDGHASSSPSTAGWSTPA